MAYIGRGIDNISQIEVLDLITFTNSAGPYNILKGAVAYIPSTVNSLLIEVDGIIQAPASYTVDGSTITFGVSMPSTSTMNSMIHFGTGLITTPADGSVTAAKIASDAVTTAKILDNNVTVAKLPTTLNISGNTVTLPASVSGLGTGITNAQLAGSIDVTSKITGVVPTANLGSGSASASTYLAGDQSYKTIVAVDIAWQAVTTGATLTAVAGRGYPIDTTSNACTVTLPASASVGDQIIFTDYARNFSTNALTINPNSLKFQGNTTPQPEYNTDGESVHIVYMDVTKGWIPINDGAVALETPQSYSIDFLVVAGGGGGGSGGNSEGSGGGGAGGYRTSTQTMSTGVEITVTVGDGGAGGDDDASGVVGNASSISGSGLTTISSAGGGYGAWKVDGSGRAGGTGGNGGGSSSYFTSAGGVGNTPSTSPAQGTAGGTGYSGSPSYAAGGGGGIGGAGGNASSSNGGNGGAGVSNSISGSATDYDGGGGGGTHPNATAAGTASHGGGAGGDGAVGSDGTVNTGGGGGGAGHLPTYEGGDGGKGVIVISVPDADYSGTTTGSPTVATGQAGSKTTMVFTGTGSYTT